MPLPHLASHYPWVGGYGQGVPDYHLPLQIPDCGGKHIIFHLPHSSGGGKTTDKFAPLRELAERKCAPFHVIIAASPGRLQWPKVVILGDGGGNSGRSNLNNEKLWTDTHPLVEDLFSMMRHNTRERIWRVDWVEEYDIVPMYLLLRITINLNTWCINCEEEVGDINPPKMPSLLFELDRQNLDWTHIPDLSSISPGTPAHRAPPI